VVAAAAIPVDPAMMPPATIAISAGLTARAVSRAMRVCWVRVADVFRLIGCPSCAVPLVISLPGRYPVVSQLAEAAGVGLLTPALGQRCPVPSRPEVPPGPGLRCLKFDGGTAAVSRQ
jgi:hypothetical protein